MHKQWTKADSLLAILGLGFAFEHALVAHGGGLLVILAAVAAEGAGC